MSADDKNFFDLKRLKMIDEDTNRRRKSILFQSTPEEERQDAEEDDVPTIFKMAKERMTNLLCAKRRRKTSPTADEYDGEGAPEQTALEEDYYHDEDEEGERVVLGDDIRY